MTDRIAAPWGGRTPVERGAEWPVRVDLQVGEGLTSSDGCLIGLLRRSDAIMAAKRHDLENANRGDAEDSR
jgi:hypothetical protein